MSQLRMLFAAVAAAVAIAFVGPMLWGAPSALAAGPQPQTNQQMWGNHHRNDGDHDRDDRRFVRRDPDHDGDIDFPRFNHVRNFNNCCFYNNNCCVYARPYYQPTYYYYQPVVAYTAPYVPNYYWINYGPNWNYGMPYYQVQQVCNDYNTAYGYSTAAYNSYVAGVCISISVSGNTVTIQITP